ncbi:hypothetical protein [Paraburkholderia ultramafica]|nr:hypothetical protein [Paraburkholderia ultramafica]
MAATFDNQVIGDLLSWFAIFCTAVVAGLVRYDLPVADGSCVVS